MKKITILFLICLNLFSFEIEKIENSGDDGFKIYTKNLIDFKKFSKDEILKCDPNLKGIYEFDENNIIYFYPSNLIMSNTYECKYQNKTFTLKSNPFKIIDFKKISNDKFLLTFNDFVELSMLRANLVPKNLNMQTSNNKVFLITSTSPTNIFIDKNLTSKFGKNLENDFRFNINDVNYKDYQSAINLTYDNFKIIPFAFKDGEIGARVYMKNYILPNKKFIKVDNVENFSITPIGFTNKKYEYYFDIKSKDFIPNKEYKIFLLKGFGNEELMNREIKEFKFKAPNREAFLKFIDSKPYFSPNSQVAFFGTNVKKADVIISKIPDYNIRYFLNFNSFDVSKFVKILKSKTIDLNFLDNKIEHRKIDLDLKDLKDGVYLLEFLYKSNNSLKKIQKIFYLNTKTALVNLTDDEIFMLITDINANILKDVNVKIYSKNNEILLDKKSSDLGEIFYKNKDLKNASSISLGDDLNNTNFIILKNPLMHKQNDKKSLKSLIYLSSDLIRSNENLNALIAIKDDNFKPIKNLPIKVEIFDPNQNKFMVFNLKLNEFGVANFSKKMPKLVGSYKISLIFKNKILANKFFNVEDFVPNRIKSKILTNGDTFFKGDDFIKFKLFSTYLFGIRANKLNGSLELNFFDKKIDYDGFSFINQTLKKDYSNMSQYFEVKLNKDAKDEILFHPTLKDKVSNAYKLVANYTLIDGIKPVSAYKDITIYPYKNILGIKSITPFTNKVKFKTILLDAKTKKEANSTITISIFKKNFNYTFESSNVNEDENLDLLDTFEVEPNKEFSYDFKQYGGEFVVVANDYLNGASASINVLMFGLDNYQKQNFKNSSNIKISLDKSSYKKSSKIRANINSSISKGKAIILFSSKDKIIDKKILDINSKQFSIDFFTPADFDGGFISATILKNNKSNLEPIRTYGKQIVRLDQDNFKFDLNISFKDVVKSNELTKIFIKSKPNLEVFVSFLDEGIANISHQKPLNGFDVFKSTPKFGINYYDIFDQISNKTFDFKTISFGGDKMLMMAQKNISPIEAKNIKIFQMMKKIKLDENGFGVMEFKTPNNFNSSIRISAFATDDTGVGFINKKMIIRDDIIIKTPQIIYLNSGNKINYILDVINSTNKDKNITLEISNLKNILVDFNTTKFTLKPLGIKNISFKLSAKKIGNGAMQIVAKEDNKSYKNDVNFTIISQFFPTKFLKFGYLKGDENFTLPNESFKNLKVSASSNPDVLIQFFIDELKNLSGLSTKELSAKLIAYLYDYKINKTNKDKVISLCEELLKRLKNDGSFGYLNQEGEVKVDESIFASDAILETNKELNILSSRQIQSIFSYLKSIKSNNSMKLEADYVLNKFNKLEKSEINFIFDNKLYLNSIVSYYQMQNILSSNSLFNELDILKKENKFKDKYDIEAFLFMLNDNFINFINKNFSSIKNIFTKATLIQNYYKFYKNKSEKIPFNLLIDNKELNFKTPFTKIFDLKNKKFSISSKDGTYYNLFSIGYKKANLKHTPLNLEKYADNFYKNKKVQIYREFLDTKLKPIDLNSLKLGQNFIAKIDVISSYFSSFIIDSKISSCFKVVGIKNSIKSENLNDKELILLDLYPNTMKEIYIEFKAILSGECKLSPVKIYDVNNQKISDYDLEQYDFYVRE